VPYVLGQVELPEGPQVLAELIDCEHDKLKIGMTVELGLQVVPPEGGGQDKVVYKWRPWDVLIREGQDDARVEDGPVGRTDGRSG
jgi:uncharacterized OB-fold protein